MGLDPTAFGERLASLRALAGDRAVSPGTRMDWPGTGRTADGSSEAARTAAACRDAEAFRTAGAEHLAVHFGDPDRYADRMTDFARGALRP
ncbi:hypothetical protein [Streptomyces griseorubiginosus]|uniref:hypothetical protein n=1 Tax=Streptomyces griseorubiginosus TaxID=67304 RepID=UPI002E80D505|nr:hypothetical protein [Streptomyces griseorubiginosus]WUB44141.1 hypothetical protein OHN19_12645 [Streptomyces griseorubiginosus]WUB52659.1 hypothetical protein OG942_12640 [Streptomyces griseorubiginosus]